MKEDYLTRFERYIVAHNIKKFSGEYYTKKDAFTYQDTAFSISSIDEGLKHWIYGSFEEFFSQYLWCFPFIPELALIGWTEFAWRFKLKNKCFNEFNKSVFI